MSNNLSLIEQMQPTEKSLVEVVNKYKNHLLKRASDNIRKQTPDKQEQFLMRTVASIIKNENLKECFNSPEGKYSVFELVDDCLKTGLELEKHVYPVPYGKKVKRGNNDVWIKTASFQIKRQGFHALLCGGDKPIFKNLLSGIVYEKEKDLIKINRATGEIDHPVFIGEDRGKVIGVWVQAIHLDNHKEAEYYPISYIHNIRNNHSKTYNDYIAKKVNSCAWVTDPIPMIEKTAIKAFCRPYADVCEALQNAYYSEGDEIIEKPGNIEETAEIILDSTIDRLDQEIKDDNNIENEKPKDSKGNLF